MLHLKDLPLLECLLVHRPASFRIVRVEDLEPSMSQRGVQWQPGVIEPGLIEIRDLFLGVRHPDHDRSGIRDETEAFFAFPQGLFGKGTFDQIRRLPGEHVEEGEILLGRDMRCPPVRREHAERLARSRP